MEMMIKPAYSGLCPNRRRPPQQVDWLLTFHLMPLSLIGWLQR